METSRFPAAFLACSMALFTPSVTNVNGDPGLTHSCGGLWVTIKQFLPPGGLPCHALAMSNILRPATIAPILPHSSRRNSALVRETLNTISVPGNGKSVSPLLYHLKSASPPSPNGSSGLSCGPATKPSSDIDNSKTTFPIFFSSFYLGY